MPASQQVTHSLSIKKLKGISSLDEVRFDEKPLTAILGPNGCGKSTILHALACCYKPAEGSDQQNWQFRDFFTPTTDSTWAGSSLAMVHSYRDGTTEFTNLRTEYRKNADRWSPRYVNRPERYVQFIGIKSCVPQIEEETYTSAINYQTETHADAGLIMSKMGTVFNRAYTELNIHQARAKRQYPGLALDGTRYSALAMGAGEQRVLEILSAVFNAPKYALLLIDEIDLLLHTAALTKLIEILFQRAQEKSLQIVFTTHREAILELKNMVSIKHIHTVKAVSKTYCFSNTKPDALRLRAVGTRNPVGLVATVFPEFIARDGQEPTNVDRQGNKHLEGAARRLCRGHGQMRLDGPRARATVGDKVMRSEKTVARVTTQAADCTQAKRAGPVLDAGP